MEAPKFRPVHNFESQAKRLPQQIAISAKNQEASNFSDPILNQSSKKSDLKK